jgi:hypothetical protein
MMSWKGSTNNMGVNRIIGPVVGLLNRYFERKFEKRLAPLVHARLEQKLASIGKAGEKEASKLKVSIPKLPAELELTI